MRSETSTAQDEVRGDPLRAPRSNRSLVIACVTAIAVAAILASMLGASSAIVSIIVVAVCVASCPVLTFSLKHLEHDFERDVLTLQQQSSRWQSKWQKLHADSQQTAMAIEKLIDGAVVLSSTGEILLLNPAARELLWLDVADRYRGRPFSEVVRHPRINELISGIRDRAIAFDEIVDVTDGKTVRPLRINGNLISTTGGNRLFLIIRDETESRRVEEIRREFVANISHELKTPLAAIKGYAETVELALHDDPKAASHFMGQIRSQCVRLERLVADMMQLARAQAGPNNMSLAPLSLGDVIADALRSCQPIAESKQIELTSGEVDPRATVMAGREATLTIANNLISNALRYTPQGGHVAIGTERIGGFWALVVEDDGVGIPESEQERIFERFYRVEKTREKSGGGTGIGLSIVKNLTLALNGEVQLSSRPGAGSTFRVLLVAAGGSTHHTGEISDGTSSQDIAGASL